MAAEASFKKLMDSISSALNWDISLTLLAGTPSIISNGSTEFLDTAPRIDIPHPSSPGAAEERVIRSPGTCPCIAERGLLTVPLFSNIFSSTTVTDPVKVCFF